MKIIVPRDDDEDLIIAAHPDSDPSRVAEAHDCGGSDYTVQS